MQLIVSSLVVLLATIPMETISIKLNNEKKAINRIATHHPMDQIKQQPDEEQQKEQQQPMQKNNQQQQGEKKFEDYQLLKGWYIRMYNIYPIHDTTVHIN